MDVDLRTLQDLILSAEEARPNFAANLKTGAFSIERLGALPMANILLCHARFNAISDETRSSYETLIAFHNIKMQQKSDSDHPFGIEVLGQVRWATRPVINKTPVKVTCSCADFYFMWWKWNSNTNALAGPDFDKYERKTPDPPVGRPYKNPGQHEGLCKHLVVLTRELVQEKFVLV